MNAVMYKYAHNNVCIHIFDYLLLVFGQLGVFAFESIAQVHW